MTDLAASDITVAITKPFRESHKKRNHVTIAFGDAALTYPSSGIPMPAIAQFGMIRNLDALVFINATDGFHYKYDPTNHTLWRYAYDYDAGADGAAIELATAPAAVTLTAIAEGW